MREPPLYPGREKHLPEGLIAKAVERIMVRAEADPFGGCLLWPGASVNDHGCIHIRPVATPFLVHRVVYCGCVGNIPDGMLVLHTCDVGICVQPHHLFVGTHADNTQDAADKNRLFLQTHGHVYNADQNPNAKLSWAQVRELRGLFEEGWKCRPLADRFGISLSQSYRIVQNKQFVE